MFRRFSTYNAARAVLRGRAAPRAAASNVTAAKKPIARAASAATTAKATRTAGAAAAAKPLVTDAPEAAEVSVRSVPDLPRKSDTSSEGLSLDNTMVAHLSDLEQAANAAPESLGDDWANSFQGLGSAPFPQRSSDVLLAPVEPSDVEITPDGLIYLPEIKYRRILNRAFGPGGWGIAPRTKTMVTKRQVTREYGLVCLGRLVSVSRGEMDYFNAEGVTTAMEGCKSNALMRCCKDLGIASELWDPAFIREFKAKHCESKYFEKRKRFVWKRKDRQWEYPYV